jgi:RHS repeat-associated protein
LRTGRLVKPRVDGSDGEALGCRRGGSEVYNYFRDYDPSVGRYVESDPIGLYGGINTFAYAEGDPLGGFDPDGLARGNGKVDFWNRPCNQDQKRECRASCEAQGKEYDSCAVRWVKYAKPSGSQTSRRTEAKVSGACKEPATTPPLACGPTCQKTLMTIGAIVWMICTKTPVPAP